jgi:hypothetical protein
MAAKKKTTTAKKAAAPKAEAKKAAPAPAPAAPESLIVGSKVKAMIKEAGCNTGGDALDGINMWVHWLIAQATKRAEANGRKTVRAHDFMIKM